MSRTISAFEYSKLRVDADLTSGEFDELVRFNDAHAQRYFSIGHRCISFRQFVGYLQIGDLGIEILPKADRNAAADAVLWRGMLHEMLKVGVGIDLHGTESAQQSLTQPSLVELVVANFVPKVERIVREGLARGYREEESNGTTFRGKLVVTEHARQNHTRRDRSFVRYSVYDRDTLPNRLLRAGLDAAARAPVSAPLRARVAARLLDFERVRRVNPDATAFAGLQLSRSTERYREALLLSHMLVENLSPALRSGKVNVFAFLFDMNHLWERYVAVLFQRACRGDIRAVRQKPATFMVQAHGRKRTLSADIALVNATTGNILAILDTKWKLADPSGPDDDHLKQMFVYNEIFGAPRAILVHPTTAQSGLTSTGTFWERNHRCDVVELGLQGLGVTRTAAIAAQVRELVEDCRTL